MSPSTVTSEPDLAVPITLDVLEGPFLIVAVLATFSISGLIAGGGETASGGLVAAEAMSLGSGAS